MCGIRVVCTLAILNKGSIGMILSKYAIPSLAVSVTDITRSSAMAEGPRDALVSID